TTKKTEKACDFEMVDQARRLGTRVIRMALGPLLSCAIALAPRAARLDLTATRPSDPDPCPPPFDPGTVVRASRRCGFLQQTRRSARKWKRDAPTPCSASDTAASSLAASDLESTR